MQLPLLVISFDAELAQRVRRIFRKSGETVDMVHEDIPQACPNVRGVIITANQTTNIASVLQSIETWTIPTFLVSDFHTPSLEHCFTTSSDRLELDLLLEVQRNTGQDASGFTVWASDSMLRIQQVVERLGPTNIPILITGESGTGKEVIAKALHVASSRSGKKLVVVDCAAIAPTLMESELFGHQKGAFTGAATTTRGLVRHAHQSTFFLDEIGELPTPVQVKLLRLLQDGSYRPVGGTETRLSDLRVIAATNRDIEAEVSKGQFRQDLYHRLNGARIHIPPLRERPSDIAPLFQRYLQYFCIAIKRPPITLSDAVVEILHNATWPGNVRELVNCAHYLASLVQGTTAEISDLPPSLQGQESASVSRLLTIADKATPISSIRTDLPYKDAKREWLDIFESQYIQAILERNDGNVSAAAKDAGMDRRSIQRMVKRFRSGPTDGFDE